MEIAIGLPTTVPGVDRDSLLEWARRSEDAGFSSLGTIDRLVYANYESLIGLTAAAAVTERIRIASTVILGPLRANAALFAKQAATLDNFSNGRLLLGLAVGGRDDDYQASGVDFHERGRLLDRQLEEMTSIWSGEEKGFAGPIGPPPHDGRPGLVIGGTADASFERAARFGDGWMAGGGGHALFADRAPRADEAWERAGREGKPRKLALGYYALGPNAEQDAESYLGDYYGFLGDAMAGFLIQGAATSPDDVKYELEGFESAGCDELFLFACSKDPAQVDLLAEVALRS